MNDFTYKIEHFEGPLDLLLHLIEKNKMNIFDIPIVQLTEQYLFYIENMVEEDLDVVTNFLVMACTLLEIKSKMLLPLMKDDDDNEIDPRDELIRRLLEYKKYKDLGHELEEYEDDAPNYMLKGPTIPKDVAKYIPEINYDELLKDITINKLNQVFVEILRRKENSIDTLRSNFGIIAKEKIPLKDTIIYVTQYAIEKKKFSFREMLEMKNTKTEVIVSFLAILELIKVGQIRVMQNDFLDDIYIEYVEGSKGKVDFSKLEDN